MECVANRGGTRRDLASSQTQIDVATFIEWVDATAHGDAALQQFYVQRFRPEFRPRSARGSEPTR